MRAGVLAAGLVLALIPAAVASGHGNAVDHLAEDSVHDVAAEPRMAEHTRSVTAADARAAAAAVAGDEHLVGQWGPVVDWPVVGVHNALMPDGRVLAYDSVGDNATETYPVHDHGPVDDGPPLPDEVLVTGDRRGRRARIGRGDGTRVLGHARFGGDVVDAVLCEVVRGGAVPGRDGRR